MMMSNRGVEGSVDGWPVHVLLVPELRNGGEQICASRNKNL